MEASPRIAAPPYFAFKTLTNMLVQMEEHGPPNRVDRTFLRGMSGAGQTQFIAGLRSLGLIDEDGAVQPRLVEMVTKPDDRPAILRQILRERYPEAVELGRTNATTGELVEIFNGYGAKGDTARKAIAFYLQAAEYAGDIPLSPNFRTPTIRSGVGSSKRRSRQQGSSENGSERERQPARDDTAGLHPAILTLVQALPPFDDGPFSKPEFPSADREAWFAYAKATFNLIYTLPEGDKGETA
jgi:hypothetical protein